MYPLELMVKGLYDAIVLARAGINNLMLIFRSIT